MLRLILIQGTAVAAAVVGLIGVFRSKSGLIMAACVCLFALTVPLLVDGTGLVTLGCALCFLASRLLDR